MTPVAKAWQRLRGAKARGLAALRKLGRVRAAYFAVPIEARVGYLELRYETVRSLAALRASALIEADAALRAAQRKTSR